MHQTIQEVLSASFCNSLEHFFCYLIHIICQASRPFMSSIPLSLRRTEERLDPAVWIRLLLPKERWQLPCFSNKLIHTHTHFLSLSLSLALSVSFYSAQPLFTPHGQKRNQHFASKRPQYRLLSLYRLPYTHTHAPYCMNSSCVKGSLFYSTPDFKQICLVCAACLSVCLCVCVCIYLLWVLYIYMRV